MSWLSRHKYTATGTVLAPGVGTAVGAYADQQTNREAKKAAQKRARATRDYGGDPNVALIDQAGNQGGNFADITGRIAKGFRGSSKQLAQHFERFRPLILSQLLKTGAAKDLLETDKFAQAAYAPGANQIESGVNQGLRSLRGSLAMNGLTAGGVYPGLEASLRFQAASARGALLNQVQMEQLQNRYNMQRDIASLSAGLPASGVQSQGGMDWGALLGQLLGAAGNVGAAAVARK